MTVKKKSRAKRQAAQSGEQSRGKTVRGTAAKGVRRGAAKGSTSTRGQSAKKSAGGARTKSPASRRPRPGALSRLRGDEALRLLLSLIDHHPELRPECETLATTLLGEVDAQQIGAQLGNRLSELDITACAGRAGRQPWGYVEPWEAAAEILEELLAPYIEDLRRRIELVLEDAARSTCLGIVLGLYHARTAEPSALLAHVPDFCEEEAAYVVELLTKESGRRHRRRWELPEGSEDLLPDWDWLFTRPRRRS
jgi:hypothetical protein